MRRKRIEYHYNPVDLENDVAVGIKLSFNADVFPPPDNVAGNLQNPSQSTRSVFQQSYTTEEQAISNLYSLLLTVKGERMMQPLLGTDLPYYVFEPLSDSLMNQIRTELTDDIRYWLPYIIVDAMNVTYDANSSEKSSHTISIGMKFRVTNQGAEQTITIFVTQSGIKIG